MEFDELKLLSEQTGFDIYDENLMMEEDVLQVMDQKDSQKFKCIPLRYNQRENIITVGIFDPHDLVALDSIRLLLNKFEVEFVLLRKEYLDRLISDLYVTRGLQDEWDKLTKTDEWEEKYGI